jgi:DNA-directed RNA polymerase beta subunit
MNSLLIKILNIASSLDQQHFFKQSDLITNKLIRIALKGSFTNMDQNLSQAIDFILNNLEIISSKDKIELISIAVDNGYIPEFAPSNSFIGE